MKSRTVEDARLSRPCRQWRADRPEAAPIRGHGPGRHPTGGRRLCSLSLHSRSGSGHFGRRRNPSRSSKWEGRTGKSLRYSSSDARERWKGRRTNR